MSLKSRRNQTYI